MFLLFLFCIKFVFYVRLVENTTKEREREMAGSGIKITLIEMSSFPGFKRLELYNLVMVSDLTKKWKFPLANKR